MSTSLEFLESSVPRPPLPPQGSRNRDGEIREAAPLEVVYAVGLVAFYLALLPDTATRVSAVTRTSLVFGFVLSYFLLRETRDWRWRVVGTALILAGTAAVSL